MSVFFSQATKSMKTSGIRELAKLTQRPEIISFAGGLPAAEMFPAKKLAEVSQKVLLEHGRQALQYMSTEGYAPLRVHIAGFMNRALGCDGVEQDDILIINGSQQGLDFSARIFVDPGSVILMESPTYVGAINAFSSYMPEFAEVSTDRDGMIMDDIQAKIALYGDRIRFIYVIPDFQNPSGITWSLERRQELLRIAKDNNLIIIEDNPYGALSFNGEILPTIYSLDHDEEKNVVFLGTFSKIMCPGYRLGWVCSSKEILSKYILCKQSSDLHSSTVNQWELSCLFNEYDIYKHIERLVSLYKRRRDVMVDALETYMPSDVKYEIPGGGFFVWLEFPQEVNTGELVDKCLEKNVAYISGSSFFPNGGKENYARLCFSYMSDEKIEGGIKMLGECLSMWL